MKVAHQGWAGSPNPPRTPNDDRGALGERALPKTRCVSRIEG